MKIQKPISRMYGSRLMMSPAIDGRASCASICTLFSRRRSSSRSEFATGNLVVNFFTSLPSTITRCLNLPVIVVPAVIVTLARLSAWSCWSYFVYEICGAASVRPLEN